ncbi:phosphoglycerate dehydrogenase [Laedolimicola ammoniilytica]|uniref:D-3-phosphoglycerate dehydrogenase n=1 Tax=Laedolimicola ammoniilytica TaxID=2981771 RepID=A0ABT2RWU8_9FIRM|nr:phosphoglycerate dehydrogenase [Laedolimicola ammoniilytica]MCU6696789.1 phosphoglycerate dehydrogenase [Laedolimicola ammoniilytica]SCH22428.1 D-3-phosphoglycerate dehydrogenase [uncultured Clostridium sp.]SCH90773.1 D-3-phosphoglycerate dehydrogenase [uncultured Clostridium sp.]
MYQYKCMNQIAQFGLDHFTEDYKQTENMEEADALLVRSAALHEVDFPENLKAIARAGAGVNNIPLTKCADQGIVVFNTPGANANGVKELVLAGMLLAARDIIGGVNWVQSERMNEDISKLAEKQKKQFAGHEIQGKKLGIIGLGAIGVQVANAATHLGMEVLGYDPYISVEAAWNLSRNIHHITNVDDIYKECDYITIHVPLLDSTKGMINAEAIEKMKDGVVVLNYARDLLVDEKAMVDALKRGKVARYMTDFPNTTTAGAKGVIVTPHLGASTEEAEENCARMAVKEVRCYLEHGNIQHSVNYPDCDMGIPSYPARVAICHKNVKNMLSQFTTILGDANYNIGNMTNKSRGDYAYSMFDLESPASPELIKKLETVDGVLKVRVIC